MARVFFGIRPPQSAIDQLKALYENIEGVHWQTERQVHITVCYVGEVCDLKLTRLVDGFSSSDLDSLTVRLKGIGSFEGSPDLVHLWAGVEPVSGMTSLHNAVKEKLKLLGIEVEHHQYRAHLTLARLDKVLWSEMGEFIERTRNFDCRPFKVDEIQLLESDSGRYRSGYRSLRSYPLETR